MCIGVRITSRSLYSIWITSVTGKQTSSWYWSEYCIGDVCVWEWGLLADPCTVSRPPLWQGNRPWVDIEVNTVLETCVGVRITSRSLYSIWTTFVTGKQTLSWYWSKYCTGDMCGGEDYQQTLVQYLDSPQWQGNRSWVDIEVSTVLETYVFGSEDYQQILVQYLDHLCRSLYSIWTTSVTGKQTLSWFWSKCCTRDVCGSEDYQQILVQ